MIYLDYQATTPLAPEARDAMLPWLGGADSSGFANPHSTHRPGRAAAAAVEAAREQVAALMPPGGQVIFTSGATEAINLAIFGTMRRGNGGFAATTIEHAAVLDCAQSLARTHAVSAIAVDGEGLLDPECDLPAGLALVAAMHVNNEIGTMQPVARLAERAHAQGALVLCDAVQGWGKLPLPQGCDMIAVSAHKLYGPKGIGALWLRDGITLDPLIHGGGQQGGLRSGTLSPALCAGFGVAANLAVQCRDEDYAHAAALAAIVRETLPEWTLNGSASQRWPGNLNLRRDGLDVARLMSDLRGIAFSAGSACASGSGRPSHVLRAIGLDAAQAKSSIRLGFGRYSVADEVREAAKAIAAAAAAQA